MRVLCCRTRVVFVFGFSTKGLHASFDVGVFIAGARDNFQIPSFVGLRQRQATQPAQAQAQARTGTT